MRRFATLCFLGLVSVTWAQTPLNRPVPLLTVAGEVSAGTEAERFEAAERALEMGFPSIAEGLFEELSVDARVDRQRARLGLASALLEEDRPAEAEKVLEGQQEGRGAAWHLRMGLAAAQQRHFDAARHALGEVKAEELTTDDRAWYSFLRGVVADAAGDLGKAREDFEQAEKMAGSDPAKAQFVLAREQARLRANVVNDNVLEETRRNMERYQGRKIGYDYAKTYAAMLEAAGRKNDAINVLQRQLLATPAEERGAQDDFRLLLGLVAGGAEGAGRTALASLVAHGSDPLKQRVALRVLARDATTAAARAQLQALLDRLIATPTAPAIIEDLLVFRAQLALTEKDYARAEEDARTLLQRFPGSPLKVRALGVLTSAAWEQRRYRTAADLAGKAAAELPAGALRAQFNVLVAEAWFRAKDFRTAADAYAAALRETPEGEAAGDLMFQRLLAEIEGGRLETAEKLLDEMARQPAFTPEERWQAEWNLARALQLHGETAAAYARVNRLLAAKAPTGVLSEELRAQMAWLQAKLSLEAGEPGRTLELVDALIASGGTLTPALQVEIGSTAVLLKAEALFALQREPAALEQLQKVRSDFPKSDAAVYSYIVEADHYAKLDNTVEAQQLLTKLADDFPGNKTYAPLALYQAALQAERRGQDANYIEANKLIEQLVTRYPRSDLVFYARLKQGDLLRKLNQFPQAQQVYESLVNNFSQHADVLIAQLALAECHNAQAANDPGHAEAAATLFEHLRDRGDAPLDLRVEAGFNLGYTLLRRGQVARAQQVWWQDVVQAFLLNANQAAELGAKGRYWMARTLLELGGSFEQQAKLEEARNAWSLILQSKLPGEALARARLAKFNPPEDKP
ncbi:tetratricopeptide repeat protein [Horticoccus luteus]|uniref:Tetratricopeptide repeat protein n=1 Tax=Horticoccus luteus TaxID=2862869 RepID=A0A8F9TXB7_9BACT|nr:tetratricopeptide repeat protein [Horticoccus luteus]QYM79716.1 tetratricopeptide repeat protein [Horticoccus luteus]